MKKAVVIVGPTAVGKTSLAIKLAEKYNSALVSADSIQVFKGLDIISGKDKDELSDINVYLIDAISPDKSFSVSQFEDKASNIIGQLSDSGILPIVVGGTGLYVKSLVDGIETSTIKPDLELRKELELCSLEELWERFLRLDKKGFEQMNDSDKKNKRRLIRKIEITSSGVRSQELKVRKKDEFEFLQIGLELSKERVRRQIDIRVEKRIKEGALNEAKSLLRDYNNLTQQVKDANGYKQLFEYLLEKITFEEAIKRWKISEYHHAKNQMTWFKKDNRIKWFRVDRKGLFEAVSREVDNFLEG